LRSREDNLKLETSMKPSKYKHLKPQKMKRNCKHKRST
jgi:hypothetical protein